MMLNYAISERTKWGLVLCVAALQGLLYLFLLPPWQHYDEPTHYEYAWLIANRGHLPTVGDVDPIMRREVAASMLAHRFYWNLTPPNLFDDEHPIDIGLSELVHPPAYYLLVSVPLRLVRSLDVTTQLYLARIVSLILFLLTVFVSMNVIRDITPPGHVLRWLLPLSIVLLPPFVDIMTAVNNDVGSVFVFAVFLWGSVRTLAHGLNWRRAAWVLGSAVLALVTKDTAAFTIVLVPGVFIPCLWRRKSWSGLSLLVGAGIALILASVITLSWGDAAYWYRWQNGPPQSLNTRQPNPVSSDGTFVLALETNGHDPARQLINPLLPPNVQQLAGQVVTVGGWVWATRDANIFAPGLVIGLAGSEQMDAQLQPFRVTTTPSFVARTFTIPKQAGALQYAFFGNVVDSSQGSFQIFLKQPFLIAGAFPSSTQPVFHDVDDHTGSWNGITFTNLLRNASVRQEWPHPRPWLERALVRYTRRSPTQVLSSFIDVQRTGRVLATVVLPSIVTSLFGVFAWGNVRLSGFVWTPLFLMIVFGGVWGALLRVARAGRLDKGVVRALALLGVAAMLVWINALARPLPLLNAKPFIPSARYTFPAIIPTMLIFSGAWYQMFPQRYRAVSSTALLMMLLILNSISIWTIWSFYHSLPIT